MKNLILLIILFVFSKGFSQQLVEKNKIWSMAEFSTGNTPHGELRYSYALKTDADTTIGDKTYLKLLVSYDSLLSNWVSYKKCLRQDKEVVYCYNYDLAKEYMLYDFGLSKSDSFWISRLENYVHVDSIRTIDSRKHFYISHRRDNTIWIENIGCLDGLMISSGNMNLVGGYSTLLCCKSGDKIIYQNPKYHSCFITTSSNTVIKSQQQLINFFQTGEGMYNLRMLKEEKGEFILYSVEGKQMFKQKITSEVTELFTPASGLLLYRFVSEKGEVQTGKVVVQ